jgi:hypothetical protein
MEGWSYVFIMFYFMDAYYEGILNECQIKGVKILFGDLNNLNLSK